MERMNEEGLTLGEPVTEGIVAPEAPFVTEEWQCPKDGSFVLVQPFTEDPRQRYLPLPQNVAEASIGEIQGQVGGRINDFTVYSEGDKKYLILNQGRKILVYEYLPNADQAAFDSMTPISILNIGESVLAFLVVGVESPRSLIVGTRSGLHHLVLESGGHLGATVKTVKIPGGASTLALGERKLSGNATQKASVSKLSISLPEPKQISSDISPVVYFGSDSGGFLRYFPIEAFHLGGCVVDAADPRAYRDRQITKLGMGPDSLVILSERLFSDTNLPPSSEADEEIWRSQRIRQIGALLFEDFSRVDRLQKISGRLEPPSFGESIQRPYYRDFSLKDGKLYLAIGPFVASVAEKEELENSLRQLVTVECGGGSADCSKARTKIAMLLSMHDRGDAVPAEYVSLVSLWEKLPIIQKYDSNAHWVYSGDEYYFNRFGIEALEENILWLQEGPRLRKVTLSEEGGSSETVAENFSMGGFDAVKMWGDGQTLLALFGKSWEPVLAKLNLSVRGEVPVLVRSLGMPRHLLSYSAIGTEEAKVTTHFDFSGRQNSWADRWTPSGIFDPLASNLPSTFEVQRDRISADSATGNLVAVVRDVQQEPNVNVVYVKENGGEEWALRWTLPISSERTQLGCLIREQAALLDARLSGNHLYALKKVKKTYSGACVAFQIGTNEPYLQLLVFNDFHADPLMPTATVKIETIVENPFFGIDFHGYRARFEKNPIANSLNIHGWIKTPSALYLYRQLSTQADEPIGVAKVFWGEEKKVPFAESRIGSILWRVRSSEDTVFQSYPMANILNQVPRSPTAIPPALNWNRISGETFTVDGVLPGTLDKILHIDGKRLLVERKTGDLNSYLFLLQKEGDRFVPAAQQYFPEFYDMLVQTTDPLQVVVATADEGLLYYKLADLPETPGIDFMDLERFLPRQDSPFGLQEFRFR